MDPAAEQHLQRLLDRDAIEDCLRRYCRGIDRLDRDLLLSAYHPDAREVHGPITGTPEEFADWYWAQQPINWTRHLTANQTIDVDGDTAHSETYFIAWTRIEDGGTITETQGRYIDQFERRSGQWRIAHRVVVREARFDLLVTEKTDRGPASPLGQRSPLDVSYSRPLALDDRVA